MTEQPKTGTAPDTVWHALTPEAALEGQGVTVERGLTNAEADSRRAQYGPNKFAEAATEPRWQAFVRQYKDPMQIVLLAAGVLSLFLPDQVATGVVLIGLTLLNAAMGLNQEGKASASVAALQKMMVVQAKTRRDGSLAMLPMDQLVPGDIVNIEAGDLVPADGRILTAATLEIDESALTGESLPVSKQVEAVAADAGLGDRVDMAFMNTQVTRGAGTILVTSTGMSTEVGHISGMLQSTEQEVTPLTRQLNALTNQILVIAGVALLISIGIGLWRDTPRDVLFLTAIAFSVSAIPTGLPAVVTAILSMGTTSLAASGAIVKRLRSVETLGSTSAINSDKTGTLTLNQMTAVQLAVVHGRYAVSGEGYSTEGQITHVGGQPDAPLDALMLPMALCADAEIRDGALVGDPTEGALVVLAAKGGVDPTLTRERYPRVATLPFDAAYKFMATFHRMTDADGKDVVRAYVKGAPDQLLARASAAQGPDGVQLPDRPGARAVPGRERPPRRPGAAGPGHRPARLRPGHVRSGGGSPAARQRPPAARARRDRRPAPGRGARRDRPRPLGGHPGPDDHRRPRRHRRGHRPPARHRRRGHHGRRVLGHVRRGSRPSHRRHRRHRPGRPRGQGPPGRHPPAQGPHRGHDRRRRERCAGAQEGRYRRRHGHHRDRGLQGSRGDDPDRRQLRHDREGGRAGTGPVRQPDALHPVPDGEPVRVHQHLPRSQHLQHPRRRPVPAAPDAVDQLHGHGVPGGRPGLQQAAHRPHGGPAPSEGRPDPAAAAVHVARVHRRRSSRP